MICKYCGGEVAIRNPTGACDHLYYPENCKGNAEAYQRGVADERKRCVEIARAIGDKIHFSGEVSACAAQSATIEIIEAIERGEKEG